MKIDRTQAPKYKEITRIELPESDLRILKNGIKLYTINAGNQEVLKIDVIFDAGTRHQPQALVASLANAMLLEGTSNLSSAEISEKIDYYGAYLHPQVEKDDATITLYTLKKYLSETLDILEDVIKYSVFPKTEFEVLLQKRKQQFLVDSEKVKVLAARTFQQVIFGSDSPYGTIATLNDFNLKEPDILHKFYFNHYSSGNCKIIVSGLIDEASVSAIRDRFNDSFGIQQTPLNKKNSMIGESKPLHHVLKEGSVQSAIRVGKLMINKKHPDYPALKFLNTVFGGYFGSRLMANIREDKGFTYGISSLLLSLRDTGYFTVITEVGSQHVQKTMDEIKKELSRLNEELITDSELKRVRNYLLGDLLRSIDGPFNSSDTLKSLIDFDLNFNFIQLLADEFRNVSSSQLRELAGKYLQAESMYSVIAGEKLQ